MIAGRRQIVNACQARGKGLSRSPPAGGAPPPSNRSHYMLHAPESEDRTSVAPLHMRQARGEPPSLHFTCAKPGANLRRSTSHAPSRGRTSVVPLHMRQAGGEPPSFHFTRTNAEGRTSVVPSKSFPAAFGSPVLSNRSRRRSAPPYSPTVPGGVYAGNGFRSQCEHWRRKQYIQSASRSETRQRFRLAQKPLALKDPQEISAQSTRSRRRVRRERFPGPVRTLAEETIPSVSEPPGNPKDFRLAQKPLAAIRAERRVSGFQRPISILCLFSPARPPGRGA